MWKFLRLYIKSMRLYYAFVTGIAGWLGLAFYEYLAGSPFRTIEVVPAWEKKLLILTILFLSWGINQIINDYLGLQEDRINAGHRPMVTGELDPVQALACTGTLLVLALTATYLWLEPLALIPALLGIFMNIVYEYAKGYGILGNLVFGLMIAMCTVFGFLAAGPTQAPYLTSGRVSVLLLVAVMNGLMTFYTYFKDYKGDKKAEKRTLVVQLGPEKARYLAAAAAFIPGLVFSVLYSNNLLAVELNTVFLLLALLTLFLELWTGYLFYKNPRGHKAYYSLSVNFRACTCGQAALIALFNTELALILFLLSYIFVGFIFNLHADARA